MDTPDALTNMEYQYIMRCVRAVATTKAPNAGRKQERLIALEQKRVERIRTKLLNFTE